MQLLKRREGLVGPKLLCSRGGLQEVPLLCRNGLTLCARSVALNNGRHCYKAFLKGPQQGPRQVPRTCREQGRRPGRN